MVVMKIRLSKWSSGELFGEFLEGLNSVSQNNSNVNGVLVVLEDFDLAPGEVLRIAFEEETGAEVVDYTIMIDNGDGTYSAEVPQAVTRSAAGTQWELGLQIASNWIETEEEKGYLYKQNLVLPLKFSVNNSMRDLNNLYPNRGDLTALFREAQMKITRESNNEFALANLKDSVGQPNGLAPLNENGQVPDDFLPSYVDDDVIEFSKFVDGANWLTATLSTDVDTVVFNNATAANISGGSASPYYKKLLQNTNGTEEGLVITAPMQGKVYVGLTSNKAYRWTGSNLIEVSPPLRFGKTKSTAYEGSDGAVLEEELTAAKANIAANTEAIGKYGEELAALTKRASSVFGATLEFAVDATTFVLTATLKAKDGTVLSTTLVDLPIEEMIVDVRQDAETGDLIVTLKNGETRIISLGAILRGLVSQEDFDQLKDLVSANETNIAENTAAIEALGDRLQDLEETDRDIKMQIEFNTQALYESGLAYTADNEETYESRITAGGADVANYSKAVLKTIVGSTVACKNLIPFPYYTYKNEAKGITWTVNADGTVVANGTPETDAYILLRPTIEYIHQIPISKGIYTLSGGIHKTAYVFIGLRMSENDIRSGYNTIEEGRSTISIDVDTARFDIGLAVKAGTTVKNLIFKPMLNEGETALPYQPYFTGLKSASFAGLESKNTDGTETSTFAFPVTETPLGRTIDFEQKKIIDKTYTVVIGGAGIDMEKTADAWEKEGYFSFYVRNILPQAGNGSTVVSNLFVSTENFEQGSWKWNRESFTTGNERYLFAGNNNNVAYLIMPNTDLGISQDDTDEIKLNAAKNWLASNPITVRFLLTTPIETPFTDEQKAAGNEYTVWKGGMERALGNENAEYGAVNTLLQNYTFITEVKEE